MQRLRLQPEYRPHKDRSFLPRPVELSPPLLRAP